MTASTRKNAIEYGMCVSRDRDDADVREALREAADRVGRQDPLRDAAVERQRSDRHGERRQAEPRDQEAVERAEHAAEQRRRRSSPARSASRA